MLDAQTHHAAEIALLRDLYSQRVGYGPGSALRHGKICHIELPAVDPDKSAAFFQRVFGWEGAPRRESARLR